MTYNAIFARSFSKHDQKKLRYGAFVGCVIIALSICTVFKPDLNPIPSLNVKVALGIGLRNMLMLEEISKSHQNDIKTEESELYRTISEPKSADIQTDEFEQKPNISQPNLNLVSVEKNKVVPIIVEPIQLEIQKVEKMLVHNVSDQISSHIQAKDFNPIQTISQMPLVSNEIPKNILKEKYEPICNTSMPRTDVCKAKGDTRIDGKSATVYYTLPNTALLPEKSSWKVKPYARKEDKTALGGVREFEVKMVNSTKETVPRCSRNHSVAGIVFSTNGYVGNHFHDFMDIIIPLYLTSREFDGEVKFVVTNKNPWWINKYKEIFQKLSNYEVIDIDKENEVHCFPKIIIGLKQHKEFDIDPSRSQHSMKSFREFLRDAYSLKKQKTIKLRTRKEKAGKPRLLIISRKRTRAFLNEREIENMAKNLGFEVVVAEADSNEGRFAKIVNSCDVMMGVHGAGLTNILYLPEKAVFIQVLALGKMEWIGRTSFGEPSKSMNLRYLEYQIGINESSLIEQYPRDHPVFSDPDSVAKGWSAYREIYLVKQNVKLDVDKFRGTLEEALKLLDQ